jgi:hypothetical protein
MSNEKKKANDENAEKVQPEQVEEESEVQENPEQKSPKQTIPILRDGEPTTEENSFADVLYEKITSVIGGDNPKQFFCMGLPGTLIDPTQYSYDVDSNAIKPAHVKSNESKLANKLFDAAFMSAGDNGKQLTTQYLTALNMLTPKLNGKLFEAKSKLREVLMTPYPYNFGDGNSDVLTLEQVFYKLYNDYVSAKEAWAQKQLDKKAELEQKYPDNIENANVKRNDAYLDWYGIVAESEELVVEEKYGKVLGVFSPGDMEIITGILESGSGRELAEARTALENVGEMNPNGGYTYPVTLYPEDWFTLLDTSFTAVDLLKSPAALSQKLHNYEMQKSNLTANINQFLQVIPNEQAVENLKDSYNVCENAFKDALDKYTATNASATIDMVKTVIDIIASNSPDPDQPNTQSASNEIVGRIFGVDADKASGIIDTLGDSIKTCIEAQNSLVDSSDKAVTAAMDYFTSNNMLQLKGMLQPLQQQLNDVNEEIAELKQQIALSSAMQPKTEADENGVMTKPDKSLVAPNKVTDRFTQIIIDSSLSSATKQSSKSSSSSQSSYGVSFFFGGYSSNSSHNEAVDNELSNNESMEIQIGMSVAKVTIDREWFNPGVFMLSSDMYNTSSEHISPNAETSFHDSDPAAVSKYMDQMNDCIFPCYPTAFVIAKDVTIKFVDQKAISTAFAQSVEDHSSKGGGFFIFGGSSSSASSSSTSASTATSSANSVTVRFTAPQILGYYLEAVAPDKSTPISNTNNSNADYISIFDFIETFKKMLDDHNAKYHKELIDN